jgi:glycosyltransferase involved in cell wall biosynthesis
MIESAAGCAVSVVIPVYRARPFIEECVASVVRALTQVPDSEVVMVDNHCDDGSIELASALLARHGVPLVVASEDIRGAGAARNRGVQRSRGAWIQFLDADDVLGADKIEAQLAMASCVQPEVGLIYSRWARCDQALERQTEARPRLRSGGSGLIVDLLRTDGFVQMGSCVIRRSAFEDVGGFTPSDLIEDVNLYVRLAAAGYRFESCETASPALLYRDAEGSLSKTSQLGFSRSVAANAFLGLRLARALGPLSVDDLRVFEGAISSAVHEISIIDLAEADKLLGMAEKQGLQPDRGFGGARGVIFRAIGMRRGIRLAAKYREIKARMVRGSRA